MKKHFNIRIFIIITFFLIIFSAISGVSIAMKYSDFEQKPNTKNQNVNINYTNIEKISLDKYITSIKDTFLNKIEIQMPTKIKMQYIDGEETKDKYFELFVHNGYLVKYDSITGSKKEYVDLGPKIKNVIYNKTNKYVGVLEENNTFYLSKYNEETKEFDEFFKVDTPISSILNINDELYILDTLNELHKINNIENTWTIEENNIYNDGTSFKKYEIGNRVVKIKFDGTMSISNNIIKDNYNNPIFAKQIMFDCTSIDRQEYEVLIIDYKGILYKKDLNSTFETNNTFELIGELKGINLEKKNDKISKINVIFTNEETKTFEAATNYEIYNIIE